MRQVQAARWMDGRLPAKLQCNKRYACGDVMKHFISGNNEIEAGILATGEGVIDGILRRARHYLPRFVDSELICNAYCEFLTDKMTSHTHRSITKLVEEFR
jgi:hypothetical protein